MKIKQKKIFSMRKTLPFLLIPLISGGLTACVDQHPMNNGFNTQQNVSEHGSFVTAIEAAKEKVQALGRNPKIIVTSAATADICAQLNLDLIGVPDTVVSTLPSVYADVERTGTAMSPDLEKIASLSPDWILAPVSLQGDLQPKFEAIGSDWAFLNLNSVEGMYQSISELGEIFDRESEAQALVSDYQSFLKKYRNQNSGREKPKVLILMGLPGSYVIATEHSYVGSLIAMAGGKNVYQDSEKQFLSVNTEDMKTKEPDIILRTAHALPDKVIEMFRKDFEENDIWKHFQAVADGRVYDLSYEHFGMSAKLNYKDALEELRPILFPDSLEDMDEAAGNSIRAGSEAAGSDGQSKYDAVKKQEN